MNAPADRFRLKRLIRWWQADTNGWPTAIVLISLLIAALLWSFS